MIKLYGAPQSRASIIQWYLEELSLPYEFVNVNLKEGEHRQAPYLAINPFGKVPAIADGNFHLWESGAILLYLAEKASTIPADAQARALVNQWILFANSTLANGLFIEAVREKEMPRLLQSLEKILGRSPFILGEKFSVVDVAVGSILAYVPIMLKLNFDDYPAVAAYVQGLVQRPAFQASIGARLEHHHHHH
nr:Chain A, Glutathione S-transferase [Synechocystis sp. PCC 6803]7PKA_B Chain B, Glutathione S-transferase [Synechocystis sp. PCC 6803]8AI8_A Chain A, Glutathione S-transferase family protein [Synechocystis sp. PCC 6803]8AI8_B Chain B, Glutathione S-transferase family protein [Synechocystis sp. PCC 6803]